MIDKIKYAEWLCNHQEMTTVKEVLEFIGELKDGKTHFSDNILLDCIIMTELIRKAAREPERTINILHDDFSLFWDKTSKEIRREKCILDTSGLNEEEKERWENLDFHEDLLMALREFISDKGNLNLIVRYDSDILKNNTIWTSFIMNENRVNVYLCKCSIPSYVSNFAVTYEAFTLNSCFNTSTCCFREVEKAGVLNRNFRFMRSDSVRVL